MDGGGDLTMAPRDEPYRTFADVSLDAMAVVEDECFTYVNAAAIAAFHARDAAEVVGRSIWDVLAEDGAALARGRLWQLASEIGAEARSVRLYRLDGSQANVSMRSIAIAPSRTHTVVAMFRDPLDMERTLLRTVVAELPVGVVVLARDGSLLLKNDEAERIWGRPFPTVPVPFDEWPYDPASALGSDVARAERRVVSAVEKGVVTTALAQDVACADGATRSLRGRIAPITFADGTPCGALATFWDVTALSQAEAALRRARDELEARVEERTARLAEANERFRHEAAEREAAERQLRTGERLAAIGTLAAGVAHEINNPLAAIVATAQLVRALNADGGRRDEIDAALVRIVDEAHRAGQTVRSLLRFGREEPGDRWAFDVNELVRRLIRSTGVRAVLNGCRLRTRLARRPPRVMMNPAELEQVLVNLIQNAVQAGARDVAVQTRMRDGHTRIVVRDDGCGIEPADRERVFDPFFTTRAHDGGSGLGLSIVHRIVTRHAGRVELRSRAGRGTSVTIALPAERAGAAR